MKVFICIHFFWICIYFSVYKFLSCVFVKECIKISPAFYGKCRLIETAWKFLQTRMQNSEINLVKSILMQIWKSFSIYSNSYKHNALKILHSLSQEFLSYILVKFVYFVKSRLFFNISKIFKIQNASIWVLFLHEHEHIRNFLNPHYRTFMF